LAGVRRNNPAWYFSRLNLAGNVMPSCKIDINFPYLGIKKAARKCPDTDRCDRFKKKVYEGKRENLAFIQYVIGERPMLVHDAALIG
jgi:hypothetical protein